MTLRYRPKGVRWPELDSAWSDAKAIRGSMLDMARRCLSMSEQRVWGLVQCSLFRDQSGCRLIWSLVVQFSDYNLIAYERLSGSDDLYVKSSTS